MQKNKRIKRILEIIPGSLSWGIIALLILLAVFNPVSCAVIIIVFDFYWIIRTVYLTTLLVMAHHRLYREKEKNWLVECHRLQVRCIANNLYHLIIFPVYKEGLDILKPSLKALAECNYPKDRMIVVVAFEERNPRSRENAAALESEFKVKFFRYLSTLDRKSTRLNSSHRSLSRMPSSA